MDRKTRLAIGVLSVLLIPFFAVEPGQGTASGRSTGDQALPILVHDGYELQNMSRDLNGSYALANDIDAVMTRTWNGGLGFAPIGNLSAPYRGVFNGRGYSITGLFINRSKSDNVGLFGAARQGDLGISIISNVSLISINITGRYGVGGLVGWNFGYISSCRIFGIVAGGAHVGGVAGGSSADIFDERGNIVGRQSCGITNCTTGGSINGNEYLGGIVGENSQGRVSNCSSTVKLLQGHVWWVGGLVGWNTNGTIYNCFSTGDVNGDQAVGGLVGINTGNISNCHSAGRVSGRTSVGGFVGINYGNSINDSGTISRSFCTGPAHGFSFIGGGVNNTHDIGGFVGRNSGRIFQSYCNGSVSGGDRIGGFAGENYHGGIFFPQGGPISECYSVGPVSGGIDTGGFAGNDNGTITGCYWDIQASGVTTSAGAPDGWNTSMMMEWETFEGWDFENVWDIVENETYPYFNRSLLPDSDRGPIITTVPDVTVVENTTYLAQYEAYDSRPESSLIWSLDTDATWLTMDNATGKLAGIPSHKDIGKYSVDVTVSDGNNSDHQRFIMTVLENNASIYNRPPVLVRVLGPIEKKYGPADELSFSVIASDPDNDALQYSWSENGVVLSDGPGFNRTFPEGEHAVKLSVSDGVHNTTQEFDFSVVPAPVPAVPQKASFVQSAWLAAATAGLVVALGLTAYAGIEPGKYRLTLLLVLPLYTRIHEEEALANETRGLIRGCILAEPGIHFNELLRRLGLSSGLAAYHLQTLERVGMIKSRNDGIFKRFYPAGMRLSDIPVRLNKMQKVIFEILREHDGLSQREVADALEISYYSVHRHINRMASLGVLRLERRGMVVKCHIADGWHKGPDVPAGAEMSGTPEPD
jgi:DNA-binding MarR family transcriptional regulator